MERIATVPLKLPELANITEVLIDPETNLLANDNCRRAVSLPFVEGSAPIYYSHCGEQRPARPDTSPKPQQGEHHTTPRAQPQQPNRPTIIESW